jgi:hypothetical protein
VDGNEEGVPVGRTHREAPEIDGIVRLRTGGRPVAGTIVTAEVISAVGPDLVAEAA